MSSEPKESGAPEPKANDVELAEKLIDAERQRLPDETFREQYLAEFLNSGISHCEECEDPRPNASGTVLLEEDEVLPSCSSCGNPSDPEGRALRVLWPNGGSDLSIIRLHAGCVR